MSNKPTIPKGTRDYLPSDVRKRNHITQTIKGVFENHGFMPIETPSFELSTTLMGKYGEEGDRLIFRILNSGEKVKKADVSALTDNNLPKFVHSLSEKALRYDLTVPFARFVVQRQNDIVFPFKRYQIQPVWRADRPQHGRYQEFYQCDGDVIGSDSLWNEVDLIHVIDEVLSQLQLPGFTIKLNHRKILTGISEVCGESNRIIDITVALDKLDKIGEEGVLNELLSKGFSEQTIDILKPLFGVQGDFSQRLEFMSNFLKDSESGQTGIQELTFIYETLKNHPLAKGLLVWDLTLARGLNYYTGAIIEVKAENIEMGSICGGGRYDDLTGLFGLSGMSGVGISFGADRIFDVLETLNLFPEHVQNHLDVLFVNFGEIEADLCFNYCKDLRKENIKCEWYPSPVKMQKQMKYANERMVKWVVLIGETEIVNQRALARNMENGNQTEVAFHELVDFLKKAIV